MLGFHLDVRTVKFFFASELSFTLCKGIQDSLGFQVLDSSICQWDSGLLELYSGFQNPGFRIP